MQTFVYCLAKPSGTQIICFDLEKNKIVNNLSIQYILTFVSEDTMFPLQMSLTRLFCQPGGESNCSEDVSSVKKTV